MLGDGAPVKRSDFQEISRMRVREARALLNAGQNAGAYYLCGYAVECALKACIAKQVRRCDFPDKELATKAFVHDLGQLIRVAGLDVQFARDRKTAPALDVNWAIAKDWSEAARYDVGTSEAQARDLYSAVTRKNGILPWVRRRW
jgi:HEPN domain-containing protein